MPCIFSYQLWRRSQKSDLKTSKIDPWRHFSRNSCKNAHNGEAIAVQGQREEQARIEIQVKGQVETWKGNPKTRFSKDSSIKGVAGSHSRLRPSIFMVDA